MYNNAWGGHHGFAKMPLKQAQRTVKDAEARHGQGHHLLCALHDDKPVAFYVNIPELNQIFRHVDGNLNAWGKLKFLYHKWRGTADTLVGLVFGIDRAYHGQGLDGFLIDTAGKAIAGQRALLDDHIDLDWGLQPQDDSDCGEPGDGACPNPSKPCVNSSIQSGPLSGSPSQNEGRLQGNASAVFAGSRFPLSLRPLLEAPTGAFGGIGHPLAQLVRASHF